MKPNKNTQRREWTECGEIVSSGGIFTNGGFSVVTYSPFSLSTVVDSYKSSQKSVRCCLHLLFHEEFDEHYIPGGTGEPLAVTELRSTKELQSETETMSSNLYVPKRMRRCQYDCGSARKIAKRDLSWKKSATTVLCED